ncbi:YfhO family protein [Bacillaceae bacterium Marseille-Q3522]|nr:YfhO family protein [Bacillaceae bacterium Marseille-Q3522]
MYKFFSRFGRYIIAFFIPFMLLGGVFVLWGVYPFGDRSILMSDQFTQYIPFYHHFYDVLRGNGSLFYTWEAGMGMNFWGTFAYYLASPVSLIVIFFDRHLLPEAFVLMTLIKAGLAGLFMHIYLAKLFQTEKITTWIFSTSYALISFSIGYFFNIMWLDSVYMLPLVLLGVEYLFRKKSLLFIISLAILFIANFYTAYMVGIFTFLYFILRSFLIEKVTVKKFFQHFSSFAVCTIAAAGISAFITIPTYLLLRGNDHPTQWAGALNPAFGFFEFFAKLYNGSIELLVMPNVFSGLLPLLLAPLFFLHTKITAKEKILTFFLVCGLFLSLQIDGLNYIWHAFEKPSGYLQRFVFVFSFVLIYLAFRAYLVFEKKYLPALIKIYLCNVGILILLTKLEPELMPLEKALFNIILLTMFSFVLYLKVTVKKHQSLIAGFLLFLVALDMASNAYSHVQTLNSYLGYSFTRGQYNMQKPAFVQIIDELNSKDKDFYRISPVMSLSEDESLQYRHYTGDIPLDVNNSLRYKFKGMSNFNTLSNGTLHQFMYDLGYSSTLGSRSLTQNNGIISTDSLFGFKYLLSDKPVDKFGFEQVECRDDVCLYQNDNALPIGFMMDERQTVFQTELDNPFEKQNQLLGQEIFAPVNIRSIQYHNLQVEQSGDIQHVKKINPDQEGSMEMTIDLQGKKQLYTLLSAGKGFFGYNETSVFVNGESLGLYPTFHNDRVLDLGAFENETVTIKIDFSVAETQLTQQLFYALDIPGFEQRISEIKTKSLQVTKWTDTSVAGNITVQEPDTLFLSIPYDSGWKAKLDGATVPVKKVGGFIGVDVDEGSHDVQLFYEVPGLMVGGMATIASIAGVAAVAIFLRRKEVQHRQTPTVHEKHYSA